MRQFSQREMSEILRLAAETEEKGVPTDSTYSLEEIQRVAGEVGMDPARIAFAAAQLDQKKLSGLSRKKWHHAFSIPIDGPPQPDVWEQMVREMRTMTGTNGEVRETASGNREWTGNSNGNNFVVTFHQAGSNPHLYVSSDRSGTEAILWTIGLTIGFLGLIAASGAAFDKQGLSGMEAAVITASSVVYGGGLWATFRMVRESGRKKLAALADRFQDLCRRPISSSTPVLVEEEIELRH